MTLICSVLITQRSLSNSEDECHHLQEMCEASQKELQELAEKHQEQIQEMEKLQEQLVVCVWSCLLAFFTLLVHKRILLLFDLSGVSH